MHFQLFATLPPRELVDRVAQAFGLDDASDRSPFTRADVVERRACAWLERLRAPLAAHYLPCKAMYVACPITVQRALTVLRHALRAVRATLVSTERHCGRRKLIVYSVLPCGASVMVLRRPQGGCIRVTFE